jgi:phospholipase/carboxylesterase
MAADELEDLKVLLPPLLRSMEALELIGRFLNPPDFENVVAAVGTPDAGLREVLPRLEGWPESLERMREPLGAAGKAVLTAFDGLRTAPAQAEGMFAAYRALGQLPRAQEALYALAGGLPPINRYFLEPGVRDDPEAQARTLRVEPSEATGLFHADDKPGSRGGFSMYVPEYYDESRSWPLVLALHGGSGNGRNFLWSWLRAARSLGAIVIAPTAVGETWALNGKDVDTPNLAGMIETVRRAWNIDADHVLMTGMSDGGTFSYLAGLTTDLPVTHLAPVSAAFHPLMAQVADADRLKGLPIYLVHGALDWMFPVRTARMASEVLSTAGAKVTYREIENLSHTYPREESAAMLTWLADA